MKTKLTNKVQDEEETTSATSSLSDMTSYLNKAQSDIAPNFLDADSILNEVPLWPLGINVFSACFCMGCSAVYHACYVKNVQCQGRLSRLDYGGISILIFGSAFPVVF